ncbi:hypothetical protein ALC152_03950 [Arcobacter sp. 15-2]|uniref:hypothetical protein n=1 Tax=Arcobacter sp. 15-2 TaxID=3374109 RepID=UPI00399C668F
MKMFHFSTSFGRGDSVTVESSSKSKLLTFLTTYSDAVVRNIKEIVFSKDYNINYTPTPYVASNTYDKVIVQALTQNYSQTFILFDIKISITEDILKQQFLKLYIKDEPIIDFNSIQFYNKGGSPIDITNLYQVQYKRNGKTRLASFYSSNWETIKDVAKTIIDGEITEIRKYIHHDTSNKKDDNNSFKSVNIYMSKNDKYRSFKIPYVKHSYNHQSFLSDVHDTFLIDGTKVDNEDIKMTFK